MSVPKQRLGPTSGSLPRYGIDQRRYAYMKRVHYETPPAYGVPWLPPTSGSLPRYGVDQRRFHSCDAVVAKHNKPADLEPVVSGVDPPTGHPGETIAVQGQNFSKTAKILIDGQEVDTTWRSSGRLETTLPPNETIGDHPIAVHEDPWPDTKSPVPLKVEAPPQQETPPSIRTPPEIKIEERAPVNKDAPTITVATGEPYNTQKPVIAIKEAAPKNTDAPTIAIEEMAPRNINVPTIAVRPVPVIQAGTKPTISGGSVQPNGEPKVGDTLKADPGHWDPTPTTFHYQWKSNTRNVGVDQDTYQPVKEDVSREIKVMVKADNSPEVGSDPTAPVHGPPFMTRAPVVTNKTNPGQQPKVGDELVGDSGGWSAHPPDVPTYSWQWTRGGTPIPSSVPGAAGVFGTVSAASDPPYRADAQDVGKDLRFEVTAKHPDGDTTAKSKQIDVLS